jgi:hypothetical protein
MVSYTQMDMIEGPEAWGRFQDAMKKVISVPHALIQKRIEEHRPAAAANPKGLLNNNLYKA